jgi:hypothetical protein
MKAVLRWPVVWEVAQIDSGRYASFLSRMTIYTLSIVGALFRYMKRWNISLQSGELGKRWKHAAQRRILTQLGSAAMRLMPECVGRGTCKDLMLQ